MKSEKKEDERPLLESDANLICVLPTLPFHVNGLFLFGKKVCINT